MDKKREYFPIIEKHPTKEKYFKYKCAICHKENAIDFSFLVDDLAPKHEGAVYYVGVKCKEKYIDILKNDTVKINKCRCANSWEKLPENSFKHEGKIGIVTLWLDPDCFCIVKTKDFECSASVVEFIKRNG